MMPSDAELGSLTVNLTPTPGVPTLGEVITPFGTVSLGGRTLGGHAPGLERLLLELEKVSSFSGVYFTSSTVDEEGISSFTIDMNLGPEVLTRRYAEGLPEEVR